MTFYMKIQVCLFEDEKFQNLLPLVYLRPVYDLRCGILTLKRKFEKHFGKLSILHCRQLLNEVVTENNPNYMINTFDSEEILFVNGRLLSNQTIAKEIKSLGKDTLITCNGDIVAARLSKERRSNLFVDESGLFSFSKLNIPAKEVEATLINYPWELVNNNGSEIRNDYSLLVKKSSARTFKCVEQKNKKHIYIAKSAVIDPFVFLDASLGPIFIDKNVRIMAHSLIQGPAYIGEGSIIRTNAKIYFNTSIGKVCKVGGEVEATIIQSYSNKQHEGFLGHAYLGSWVNLGADTNNSDLKNNYSNVSVFLNGKNVDTGSRFLGLIMGDHSKTAINTMFNTGTIVGISSNIFGAGFPPRHIPSFSWGGADFIKNYDIEKSIDVARIVMARRNISLPASEEKLLRNIYETAKNDRNKKN
jgi:UDP-N-acetylglucosamine diphosphorylase / glucose-1-phosphate thymidylyltransferase / UDP-N-acetylgalactosamine diphosphorylase / glucosamine-1-phosphate N-acetyltransferase / galactosamine-1-phosphate N-acetyltransferase